MTDNAERELLPCPWCGGGRIVMHGRCLECKSCGASGPEIPLGGTYMDMQRLWQARTQASGVPDKKPDVYANGAHVGNMLEASYNDGWNACRDAMLTAASTPPKGASVPVERLERLLESLKSVPVSQGRIYESFEELIVEYKV